MTWTAFAILAMFSSINELNEIAGLFFVIYLEEFGETRSKTAWVF